jgi:hypothetical protein
LRKQGMDSILHKTDLKMRVRHTIVPHVRIHIVYVSRGLYNRPALFHSETKCHCMAHQMLFRSSRMMRAGTVMCVVHQLNHITNSRTDTFQVNLLTSSWSERYIELGHR